MSTCLQYKSQGGEEKINSSQDDLYELELLDEEEGLWVVDRPYKVERNDASQTGIKRTYLYARNSAECNQVSNEIGTLNFTITNDTPIRMNGKQYHGMFVNPRTYPKNCIINPPKEICIESGISQYCNQWYDIFYLVCGRLKGIDILEWFDQKSNCTKIGNNIATAMVKVAATRIFSSPEQSIVEIIANSIDSYAAIKGKPKIGRFGMGFFSFLYYLVGHPNRCLYITTTTFDTSINTYSTVYLRIKEIEGNLKFSVRLVDTKSKITGTKIHLDTSKDAFNENEIKEFNNFIGYLSMTDETSIKLTTQEGFYDRYTIMRMINGVYDNSNTVLENSVFVSLTSQGIEVSDRAQGMSLDIVINSLLTPSISTKTIKVSEEKVPYENYSDIIFDYNSTINPRFKILVNKVTIVDIPINKYDLSKGKIGPSSVIISLPSNTTLPVTRDDIIINSVKEEFQKSCLKVYEICVKLKNVLYLEYALNSYKMFTANVDNKQYITSFIDTIYKSFEKKKMPVIKPIDAEIYETVFPNYIIGSRIRADINENILNDAKIQVRTDIFANKRVVLLEKKNVKEATNGSTYSYLFIPYEIHTKKDWNVSFPLSYKYDWITSIQKQDSVNKEFVVPDNLKPYTNHLLSLGSVLKNAIEVKLKTKSYSDYEVSYKELIKFFIFELEQIHTYLGEDFFHYCLNEWIVSLASIEQMKNYAGERKGIIYSRMMQYYYIPHFERDVILGDDNTITRWWEILPNYKRILKEFYIASFKFNIDHNKSQVNNAIVSPSWWNEQANFIKHTYEAYNKEIFTRNNINWIEATLGRLAIEYIDRNVYHKIKNSNEFYMQLNIIYEKYLQGMQDSIAIFKRNWTYNPIYSAALKDLILWCNMFVNQGELPSMQLNINLENANFTTKQLINYVFKHDEINFDELENETDELDLQILEIAVNAGTTKPFLEATLTELIQNSLDAIRIFDPPNKTVDIFTKKIGNSHMAVTIQDYVGMTFENIIAMCIPFYSNKKASELVTGEMGTGFFNVYRESVFVMIETVRDRKCTKFMQVPLRDEKGNVMDIATKFNEKKCDRERGTEITFVVPCKESTEQLHFYNRVFSFVNNAIGLMNFQKIKFNGHEIKKSKTLIFSYPDQLDCYYCETPTSYILTKGVPFYPLYDFFIDKKDIGVSKELLELSRSNIIIDIKHDFYTPVQSRTRLNISPQKLEILKSFLFGALTRALFEKVYIVTRKYSHYDSIQMGNMTHIDEDFLKLVFRDWDYRGPINQVIPSEHFDRTGGSLDSYFKNRVYWDGRSALMNYIIGYEDAAGRKTPITFRSLISRISEKSSDITSKYNELIEVKKFLQTLPEVKFNDGPSFMQKVSECLSWWISRKYTETAPSKKLAIMGESKEESKDVSKLVKYVTDITQHFVDIFIEIGNTYTKTYPQIKYPDKISVKAKKDKENYDAYYNNLQKTITLSGVLRDLADSTIEFQKNIDRYISSPEDLRTNNMFKTLFGYTEPCSTVVHELEHARRGNSHDTSQGMHDDITMTIFDQQEKRYIYSECANLMLLKFTERDKLIIRWLEKVKNTIKL